MVTSASLAVICPVRLRLALMEHTGGSEEMFVFRGFIGRLVSKTPGRIAPEPERIEYDQILHYMYVLMAQRCDGLIRSDVSETACHVVRAERGRFRGGHQISSG